MGQPERFLTKQVVVSIPVSRAQIRSGRDSTPNLGSLSCAVKKATKDDNGEVDSRFNTCLLPIA